MGLFGSSSRLAHAKVWAKTQKQFSAYDLASGIGCKVRTASDYIRLMVWSGYAEETEESKKLKAEYYFARVFRVAPQPVPAALRQTQMSNVFQEIAIVGHDEDFRPQRMPEPTAAIPGSEEKIKVLMARLERGEELWHPNDVVNAYWGCEPMRTGGAQG